MVETVAAISLYLLGSNATDEEENQFSLTQPFFRPLAKYFGHFFILGTLFYFMVLLYCSSLIIWMRRTEIKEKEVD
jgi:hypothetical protein